MSLFFLSLASQTVPVVTVVSQTEIVSVNIDDGSVSSTMDVFTVKDGLITQGVHDDSLCWVSKLTNEQFPREIVRCRVNGTAVIIQQLRGIFHYGIAYDWISRKLYLSTEEQPVSGSGSVLRVYRCDIEPAVEGECNDVIYEKRVTAGSDGMQLSTLLVDATQG